MDTNIFVVGGGPAGLTASIYLSRLGYKPILIEKAIIGGLVNLSEKYENYPGFPSGIAGMELSSLFEKQAKILGTEFIFDNINSVDFINDNFVIKGDSNSFVTKSFILSTGTIPKRIGIKGEDKFIGHGVSYCAICDAPFYKGKKVAVIGGGNTALHEAIFLSGIAEKVYLIHRKTSLRAFDSLEKTARDNPKIHFILNAKPIEIIGENIVKGLSIEYEENNEQTQIDIDGVFVYAGWQPNTSMLSFDIDKDANGFILTDEWMMSSIRGMFVAGDIRSKNIRQIVTAVSDGAISALGIDKFLKGEI